MLLEQIITLASQRTEIEFRAMERSLRSTGSDLPILVIPYDDTRFDLPARSRWLEDLLYFRWVRRYGATPMIRKRLSLTMRNYQFVDTDVIFLRNPQEVLSQHAGFVVCCAHWATSPGGNSETWISSEESRQILMQSSSLWRRNAFCAGQYACDRAIYSVEELTAQCERHRRTCLQSEREQPGTNLLVMLSGVPLTNLTLPPFNMESSAAIDYPGEFVHLWQEETKKPYLLHYYSGFLYFSEDVPINHLFYRHLTKEEQIVWQQRKAKINRQRDYLRRWPLTVRILNRAVRFVDNRFWVQPNGFRKQVVS